MTEARSIMIARIQEAQEAYRETPAFTLQAHAVARTYQNIKSLFDSRDIEARVRASRAATFIDLLRAIDHMNYL